MTENDRNEVQQMIQAFAQQQQFGPAVVPFHTHNGIDSPTIKSPITSYMGQVSIGGGAGPVFPKGWTVTETAFGQYTIIHNLGYLDNNYTVYASSVDTVANYIIEDATALDYKDRFVIRWAQLVSPLIFATGTIAAGATSATLTANWTGPTGVYFVTFSNGEFRSVTLTNGATTATWSGGLASSAGTQIPVSAFANVSFMFTLIVGSSSKNTGA